MNEPAQDRPDQQSKPVNPLAGDWGWPRKTLAVLAPALLALAAYLWCAAFEPNCRSERDKSEDSAKSIAVADVRSPGDNEEKKRATSEESLRCSKVCYVVHHTIEDV